MSATTRSSAAKSGTSGTRQVYDGRGVPVAYAFFRSGSYVSENISRDEQNRPEYVKKPMVFIDPDNPLAVEILQESGEAYFAACRKMVDSLEALRAFDGAVALPVREEEQIARRSELLDNAAERVHFVLIQREAMKLSRSETFFEDYEVPAEVRARLGQR